MDKNKRLEKAIEYLRSNGKVHTQKDVAMVMGATPANVSGALKGNEKILTDNFLRRFNRAFGNIFNIDWLVNGIGDMFCPPISGTSEEDIDKGLYGSNIIQGDGNHHNTQHSGGDDAKDKEIEALKGKIDLQGKMIADKDEEIKFLREMLRKK